jgi:hypothetical protein
MTYFSRGKNVIQDPYCFPDMYASYIAGKEVGSLYYVTYTEYVDICSMFYQMIMKEIIDNGERFKLPFGMGEMFVRKIRKKTTGKLPIDWVLSVQHHKRIYNLNEHTSGFGYKFFWTKPCNIKNKFLYRIVFTRANKRGLAKAIKHDHKDFFER